MQRILTKEEYILEILKDDLSSGKHPQIKVSKDLITKANLSSDEENLARCSLVKTNGAFGSLFERDIFQEFTCEEIHKESFLQLQWCPKGQNQVQDDIDLMTDGSRYLSDLLKFVKNPKESIKIKVKETVNEFFDVPLKSHQRVRLFIFQANTRGYILDGNHRAGAIIKSLAEGTNPFPITIYKAKIKT